MVNILSGTQMAAIQTVGCHDSWKSPTDNSEPWLVKTEEVSAPHLMVARVQWADSSQGLCSGPHRGGHVCGLRKSSYDLQKTQTSFQRHFQLSRFITLVLFMRVLTMNLQPTATRWSPGRLLGHQRRKAPSPHRSHPQVGQTIVAPSPCPTLRVWCSQRCCWS